MPNKTGADLIADERQRQIEKEGWTAEHDDDHAAGELSVAAALYAAPIPLYAKRNSHNGVEFYDPWPWFDTVEITRYENAGTYQVPAWDKRKKHSRMRRLVIAGALIAAEIDRIQRMKGVRE
jgi:hypothetical protein